MRSFHFFAAAAFLLASPQGFASESASTHTSNHDSGHSLAHEISTPEMDTQIGMEALHSIQEGNVRFLEGRPRHPHQEGNQREELTQGQAPLTIALSCSDSRVPPEVVFDQGLGDVFTIRSAGHVVNSDTIASIEYAVEHLGSKLLVVMGHESCGAVKAAISTPADKSAGSVHLDHLLSEVRPHIEKNHMDTHADPTLHLAVKDHVSAVMRDLVKRSRIIRDRVHSGRLVLAEGIYSLKTGRVEFWDIGEKFSSITKSY